MPRDPIVSVIVPCFDAARTIAATIDSARGQTLAAIEIIAVDDGSRDDTPALLAALARADHRVRVVMQVNAGVSAARNAGIRHARAGIVALLDSDDLWAPGHLELHVGRLAADTRLGVSFATARFIDAAGAPVGRARPKLGPL